jgi:DNA polymerase-3 subunit epsilon
VIEVGAVLWSVDQKCIVSTYSDLLNIGVENGAEAVNHISPEAMKLGSNVATVSQNLARLVDRADAVCAHRVEFDKTFIQAMVAKPSAYPIPDKPWFCTKNSVEWPLSKPGDALAYVAIAHHVPIIEAHRALSDCLLIARCFERCAELEYDVQKMIERAMKPRELYKSMQSFADNSKAKEAGFGWVDDGARKGWFRTMILEPATDEYLKSLPFRVERVAE